ncbi:hypothetical protein PG997_012246 [Apiospora hydei]|uniref:AA1-like domain-containing protein n=1 Tax=Apiospora hydei TaxID=1337664 RepID=A0ABR1V2T7_9PEZI
MQSFVIALAALLPLAAASPIGRRDDNKGCSAAAFHGFAWEVKNFDYHASYIFSTPAHQNSWGYVNFSLSNPALLYDVQCSADSSQLSDFFYGNIPYSCTGGPNGTTTQTTFDFSRPSGQLNISQTWVCSDEDPQWPSRFTAWGSVNLTLDCTDETTTNPNWKLGDVYSDREVKCAPSTVSLTPYQMAAVA